MKKVYIYFARAVIIGQLAMVVILGQNGSQLGFNISKLSFVRVQNRNSSGTKLVLQMWWERVPNTPMRVKQN